MSLTLDENNAEYQIRAYKPGLIQVNEKTYHRSIIVSPKKFIDDWQPQTLGQLTREDFAIILTLQPDILLIGTGDSLQFPDIAVYGDLMNHGIGVEIMNTHAACRTYTVLTAEERNVVAALLL